LLAHGARQHKVRDVGARQQQDEDYGSEHDQQGSPNIPDDFLVQRRDQHAPSGIVVRVNGRERRRDAIHVRLCLRQRHARPQPRDHVEVVAAAIRQIVLAERQRHEEVHALLEAELINRLEALGQDANDGVLLTIQRCVAADDAGVATEMALPQAVRENHDVLLANRAFFQSKGASEQQGHAEHVEVVCRHAASLYLFRRSRREREPLTTPTRYAGERPVTPLPIRQICRRYLVPLFTTRVGVEESDQPLWFGVRQRAQQHGIDHRKERGVRAYTQG
jgi:hypothetical protein